MGLGLPCTKQGTLARVGCLACSWAPGRSQHQAPVLQGCLPPACHGAVLSCLTPSPPCPSSSRASSALPVCSRTRSCTPFLSQLDEHPHCLQHLLPGLSPPHKPLNFDPKPEQEHSIKCMSVMLPGCAPTCVCLPSGHLPCFPSKCS